MMTLLRMKEASEYSGLPMSYCEDMVSYRD